MKRFQKASPNFKFMRFQARINNMDFTLLAKDLGIAPGVPTMKGAYGDPENTGIGYNTIITELGDHSVPANWEQYVVKRGPGETPGPPIIWSDPQNPEDAQPGYGYVADDTTEEETFFYHSDHLGSTSYITDNQGNITQYTAYLPYGELLVDEHSSSEDLPYKFNGKELDEETGLYYYGARYLNPTSSVWYGVDPLAENKSWISGFAFCFNNPLRFIDPDGLWEWDTNGNLVFQKGDNIKTMAAFLGTSEKNASHILKKFGIKEDSKGKLNLTAGQILSKDKLWIGTKSSNAPVVKNTKEAVSHYFKGKGVSADVGDESTKSLLSSTKFREKHAKITSQVVEPSGYFSVDLTKETFHIGRTNVDYNVSTNGKSSAVTYTLFSRDGFWDPDFIDEKVLGGWFGFSKFKPDGAGPNLERGGTPYYYKTRERTYFFKPVE